MSIGAESKNTDVIQLGYRNEKDVTKITFDITAWVTQYPGIICQLTVTDKDNKCFVPGGQTQNGNALEWTLRRDVTGTEGDKEIVLRGVTDTVEKRSAIFRGFVKKSHAEPGTPPEEIQGWISDLMLKEGERRAAEAERAEAEVLRGTAETERQDYERDRSTSETTRGQNEQARGQNEQMRGFNEEQRLQRELERVSAEQNRAQAETGRGTAEQERVSAEQTRAAFYAGFNADLNGKASVGQVMRRMISRTIAAGENVSAITWTQDDAGQPLALIEAEIRITIPANAMANGVDLNVYGRVNDAVSGYTYLPTVFEVARGRNVFGTGVVRLQKIGVGWSIVSAISGVDAAGTAIQFVRASGNPAIGNVINKLYLYMLSAGLTYFPTGTVFEIWGRTA